MAILWAQSERSSPLRHRNHRSSHGPAPSAKQGLRAAVFHSASKLMQEILHLNLHREFFSAIARKQKRIEYREQSPYWRRRLEDRKYDAILFRNGYAKTQVAR
jgi:hypothetical protein